MGVRRKKTLLEKAQEVTDQVVHAAQDGLEKAGPLVEKATEKAAPLVEKAGDKAAPLVEKGRELAVEKAALGAAFAATAAAAAKTGAQDVQDKVATLVDDAKPAPKKKKGKLRKFVLFSLLAGAAAFAVKKLTGGKEADKWQSSYTPPPAPTPVPKASPAPPAPAAASGPVRTGDDPAGADPAEALADAAEKPHPVTTPDKPAEEIELEKESESGDVTSDPLPASDEPAPEVPGKTGKTLE